MAKIRYRYQTLEFSDRDIHIRCLRDNQQYEDRDGRAARKGISAANWPYFGIIWHSGHVLAKIANTCEIAGRRILEVGCGIGLASLVLNQRRADITATDYHPEAENFMLANTLLNEDRSIPFECTAWEDKQDGLGKFDLIMGSDLLYERGHAQKLAAFICNHADTGCQVLLVDPGRGQANQFARFMSERGYSYSKTTPLAVDYLPESAAGSLLTFVQA